MDLLGKTTIHPAIFFSGKVAGYSTWAIQFLFSIGIVLFARVSDAYCESLSLAFLVLRMFVIDISLINLGCSTRLGLPEEKTAFKSNGLYRISRNPMYVGFNLLTLSSMLYTLNVWVALLGIYSMVVYHLIIVGEEKFLAVRFGAEYAEYKKRVRQYM